MKYSLSACPFFSSNIGSFLCMSVYLEFFFKTACQIFLHEVRVSSNFESDKACFFVVVFLKNVVLKFLSQKGQKWTQKVVFPVISNINAWNIFHKITQLESIAYFGKNLVLRFSF